MWEVAQHSNRKSNIVTSSPDSHNYWGNFARFASLGSLLHPDALPGSVEHKNAKTDSLYSAISNVQALGLVAEELLAEGTTYSESDYANHGWQDGYKIVALVREDCKEGFDWDAVRESVKHGSVWLRCAVVHLHIAKRAIWLLLLQLEALPPCVWKDQYRILVREMVSEFGRFHYFHKTISGYSEDGLEPIYVDNKPFIRSYLERLTKAFELVDRLMEFCLIEIALDPSWLSPEQRKEFERPPRPPLPRGPKQSQFIVFFWEIADWSSRPAQCGGRDLCYRIWPEESNTDVEFIFKERLPKTMHDTNDFLYREKIPMAFHIRTDFVLLEGLQE